MIPAGPYKLIFFAGDSYHGPRIVLPDLTPFGGPSSLAAPVVVSATLREKPRDVEGVELTVNVLDPAARELRLTLDATETADLPREGWWDLQVTDNGWIGTPLAGPFETKRQVTR